MPNRRRKIMTFFLRFTRIFASNDPWVYVFLLIILAQASSLLLMPIVYDTKHLIDTLFLLNEGWRVYVGMRPGVDFGSFYPGLAAQFVSMSFSIFGASVRALDAVPLLQALVAVPLAMGVLYRRTDTFSLLALAAVISTLLLTRAPLEDQVSLTDLVSAHSFSYNRLGLAFSLILLALVLLPPTKNLRAEVTAGFSGGVALALAILSKWSFFLLLPAVLLALLLQRRYAVTLTTFIGFLVSWMLLDPLGSQFLGSVEYMAESARAESNFGGLGGMVNKAVLMVMWHLLPLALLGFVLWHVVRILPVQRRFIWISSFFLMSVAVGGNLLVMGSFIIIGHQIIPVIATLAVISFVIFQKERFIFSTSFKLISLFLVFLFLIPHLANSILVTAAGFKNKSYVLTPSGAMDGYLHRHIFGRSPLDIEILLGDAASEVSRLGTLTTDMQYLVFVDGLIALQSMGDLSRHGVVADGSFGFEFAVGSRPVVAFPLWPRLSSPEITSSREIPDQADIVMVLRYSVGPFGEMLVERMGDDFRPCVTTNFWEVFVRPGNPSLNCG